MKRLRFLTGSLTRSLGPLAAGLLASALPPSPVGAASVEMIDVAPVWAGHPVGFQLLTHKGRQYVAFYDAERHMTVATRPLEATTWTLVRLPEKVGWDSHNYIQMAFDDDDHLHLSGNLHGNPLVYFRTTRPLDAASLERVQEMTGQYEERCTYPNFLRGAQGEFLFTYRDGSSGSGNQIYNVYDGAARAWRRLMDQPLTDGRCQMNAYFHGPLKGPDGFWHLLWVWRDTPDCATNHHLSYARSRDLVHWETSAGKSLPLPITLETGEVIDPSPPGGGLINGCQALGFDSANRPVVNYHKYDAEGKSQIWLARLENGTWRRVQATQWDHEWKFSGGGSIVFDVHVSRPHPHTKGELAMYCSYPGRTGTWTVDEETLLVKEKLPEVPSPDTDLMRVRSEFPGMQTHLQGDTGKTSEPGVRYQLRWETLGANRDKKRDGPLPAANMLQVVKTAPGEKP